MTDEEEALNDRLAREHDIDEYYDNAPLPIRMIEQRRLDAIRELAEPEADDTVLEIGCGGGHVLRRFPEGDLTGIDVSSVMLEKAEKNLAGFGAKLRQGTVESLKLASGGYDIVICSEVLEHVKEPDTILKHIQRLMRVPDGRAIITLPNDRLIDGVKGAVVKSGLSKLPFMKKINWGGDEYHQHRWTIDEMRLMLSRYFEIDAERMIPNRVAPVRCCFRCVLRKGEGGR